MQHTDGAIVQILCHARADLNAVDGKGDRHFDVVRLLVCARANLEHASPDDDCGNTALQRAAWKGDEEGVRVLLHLGADASLLDQEGTHPWERRFGLEAAQRHDCFWQRECRCRPPVTAGACHAK